MDLSNKLPKGTVVESFNDPKLKYKIIKLLGKGGFGNVFEVKRSKDSKVFAMKVVSLSGIHHKRSNEVNFRAEATRLMQVGCNHLHIMELMDVATFDGYGALILELATEGNLQDVYRRVSKEHHAALSQRVAYEMIEALHHIHSQNPAIVHRDIKPDNILVFLAGTVRKPCYLFKLADFGISQTVDDDDEDPAFPGVFHQPMSGRAFRPYRAPETAKVLGDIHPRGFESKADIYSLGVVLSEIHNNNVGNSVQPSLRDIPAQALPLIKAMLTQDHSKRPSAQDCKRYLWYKEGAVAVIHKVASGSKGESSLGESMKHLSIE
ncbi:kinase-like protein [Aureobasidium sp. EXF-12298]|jgi:serine/threonine protein kinase|nr:kinase-like protein [Aureobasidium sp. EXF-12298]KAI4762934.1 kinase-like protein [Aureobasidium sp. EXF-12344]KAI4776556.1 kinase-like protein [Aureobasidium sp. EXF-3400]